MRLLPRLCPVCDSDTIIGHGQRLRQCHDNHRAQIWVRRGICKPCKKTYTILPDWLAPSGQYSLYCRQQSCEAIAAGHSADDAAPHCKDPTRLPDPSTVRRWAQRRLLSLWCWAKACPNSEHFFHSPTMVAWDLRAFGRILPIEVRSP